MSLDIEKIRSDFPALFQKVNNHNLIYLDSAATSLKPRPVIDRLSHFYAMEASNVHRGAHFLSDRATDLYEGARKKIADFIKAPSPQEIIFTRGTTESLNLIAFSFGSMLNEGDEIIVSDIEHHANIVPWQMLSERKNLKLRVLEAEENGSFSLDKLQTLITPQSKILAITHASNHLGQIVDLRPLIQEARKHGIVVVVDGAQAIGKFSVDVKSLDADFYVFSGHKMFAPFGIGVLFGKASLLEKMPPYQGGGSMISRVSFKGTTFNDSPFRFEAGTPNVGGAVALVAAIEYIQSLGLNEIESYERLINQVALEKLSQVSGLELLGPKSTENKIPLFSFNIDGLHHSDVGHLLNQQGIAVRTGHHCTQPLLEKRGLTGSIRASFSIYNTLEEIDALIKGLEKAKELLQ